jgi:hypothetical protein
MAAFRIWAKVQELAADMYLATVVAIPEGRTEGQRAESETRTLESHSLAVESIATMVSAMSERIRKRGDSVTRVEMV